MNTQINGTTNNGFIDTRSIINSYKQARRLRLKIDKYNPIIIHTGTTQSICHTIGNKNKNCILHLINYFLQSLLIELDIGQLFYIQIDIKYNRINKRQPLTNIKYFNAHTYVVRKMNNFVNYSQKI